MTVPDPGWWGYLSSLLPMLTTLAATIAAILAWAAKLWWSKEFGAAKDAQIASLQSQITNLTNTHTELIKAKNAQIVFLERQIKSLQELNPTKLREYVQEIKLGLGEYNDHLKQKIEEMDSAIQELELRGQSHLMAFTQLTQEKANLESQMADLKKQVGLSREEILSRLSTEHSNPTIISFISSYIRQFGNPNWHPAGQSSVVGPPPSFMKQGLGVLDASPQEADHPPKDSSCSSGSQLIAHGEVGRGWGYVRGQGRSH